MQRTDKRILTPTKALRQVSQGLTPPAPHPPQHRSLKESPGGSNRIHWDAGPPPVPEGDSGCQCWQRWHRDSQSSGIIWRSAPSTGCPRVCWDWKLPGMMSPTQTPSAREKAARGGHDGHPGGHRGVSPVPSRTLSTAGHTVAPCSSSRPGAGRWHRRASPPPSSGCPWSPHCAPRSGPSTAGRGQRHRGGDRDTVSPGAPGTTAAAGFGVGFSPVF